MRTLPLTLAALACLVAAGCESPPPPEPREEDRALERAIREPVERAQAVEQDVLESARRVDEAMQQQEDDRRED